MTKKKPAKRARPGSMFITLPPEMCERLRAVCVRERRNPSQQIAVWLEPHLTDNN